LRINGLFENGWPGGKAKSAQNRVHPAKHAGPARPGNDLLTIPTYLRQKGCAGPRISGISRKEAPPWAHIGARSPGFFMAAKAKKADAEPAAEAEEAPEAGTEEQGAKPKRKLPLKLIAIAAGGLAVLGGGGTGAYLYFGGHHAEEKPVAPAAKPAIFVDLPDVMVNLAGGSADHAQYLKVKIVLEVPEASVVPMIQPLMPRVMDAFQTYLRELRPTDLDGSAGLYRLKEELTRRVNAAVAPNRITAVLFKEIVVQ
jgi:flagellar FliL protein